jgi:type I restriction enzyme S subunit
MQNSKITIQNNQISNENWETMRIKDIAQVMSGYGFPLKYQGKKNGQIPFIKVRDISQGIRDGSIFIGQADNYINKNDLVELKAKVFPKNTVIFAKIGEALKLNRRALLGIDAVVDNNVMGVYPDERNINPRFLYYYFKAKDLTSLSRSTTVPSLRKSDIEELTISYPDIEKQISISNKLSSLIEKTNESIQHISKARKFIKSYRQSVLSAAVTGKLTEEWREKNKDISTSKDLVINIQKENKDVLPLDEIKYSKEISTWVSCKISNIFSVQTGSTPYRKNDAYYKNGKIPWVKTGEVQNCDIYSAEEKITDLALKETNVKLFPVNTILIAMYGEGKTRGQVGRLKIKAATNQACAALVNPYINDVLNEYVFIYILSQYENLRQRASGGNQPNLNLSKIKTLSISIPPYEEIEEIVVRVKSLLRISDKIESQIENITKKVEKLTQSILSKAFRGEL